MPDFKIRSRQPELIDRPVTDAGELTRNFDEIALINRRLGGHAVTLKGLKMLLNSNKRRYSVLDIGCGEGDTLRVIDEWARKNSYSIALTGVDINKDIVRYAREKSAGRPHIRYECADYEAYFKGNFPKPDIVVASLFCHHLAEPSLNRFLKLIAKNAQVGFVVNDLHRHPAAYFSIKWLTAFFSRSKLTKNDAPLSVLRGFTYRELKDHCASAGVAAARVCWRWAFRYLVVGKTAGVKKIDRHLYDDATL